jgi:phage terminase small subunit
MTESTTATKLTAQQVRFYARYVELLGNKGAAYQAAVECGYSAKTASQSASRLLNSVKGKAEVARRLDELGMPATEVAARITTIARADIADFFRTETVIEYPKRLAPLAEVIALLQQEILFEEEYAERIGLSERKPKRVKKGEEPEPDPYDVFFMEQQKRKERVIRLQLRLKHNPNAKELMVDGPVEVQVQRLDLNQARERGALHLLKSSKPTKFGPSVELYPADGALRDMAKYRGMLVNRVEVKDVTTPRQMSDEELLRIAAGQETK